VTGDAVRIEEALRRAQAALAAVSDTPASDARLLLADALAVSPTWVLAHNSESLAPEVAASVAARLERCVRGEPLPYVLGWWEFYGRRFAVGPAVLIPRPETELLVDYAVADLRRRGLPSKIVDVGTGSGCIAVSIAAEVPEAVVVATDVSRAALAVARKNAAQHGVASRLRFVAADLLDGVVGPWDVLCANLPYVARERIERTPPARTEPVGALDGGLGGVAIVGRLLRSLGDGLSPAGVALVEIDEGQGRELLRILRESLPGSRAQILPDLAGRERLLVVRRHADGR